MRHVSGAVGAAVLAASSSHFGSLSKSGRAMSQIEKEVRPDEKITDQYGLMYQKYMNTLKEKGYLKEGEYA